MCRSRCAWVVGVLAATVVWAESTAHAVPAESPALYARFQNFTGSLDEGPACFNVPGKMPTGRQFGCSFAPFENPSTGVYRVKLLNGAPLPATSGNDAGYAVFVTPVGSNALCAETAVAIGGDNSLTSTINCVSPTTGLPFHTKFLWHYRTDSTNYPQASFPQTNFAYARINRGSPPQTLNSQSFNPFQVFGAGPITTQRISTGNYRVTLVDVNVMSSWGLIDATYGLSNVVVQRTCTGDNSASCKRTFCNPTGWWLGTQAGDDMTVDVKCYLAGAPVDADFRILVAHESHTSQSISRAVQYGWANAPGFGGAQCLGTSQFLHHNWHQGDVTLPPMSMCRNGTGAYKVTFGAPHAFYHSDAASVLLSSRTVVTYCNVGSISCGDAACLIDVTPPSVDVRCYDASGAPVNAVWNMSVAY
jgi:hypothetical protein